MARIPAVTDFIEGAVSCEIGDGWIKPWRIVFEEKELFCAPGEALVSRAECAAGVRMRFRTDADAVSLRVLPHEAVRSFDLVIDNELLETVVLDSGEETVAFRKLPAGEKTVEIWLPHVDEVKIAGLDLPDGASCVLAPDTRRRWVTYGSSISHCGAAHSPARTWPGTAARLSDMHLTCLGYGGNCHMEPMVTKMLRDLPADLFSLKVGINVQGGCTLSPRTFKAAVVGMVRTIREKHPVTPIILVSPVISPGREENDNGVGLSLQKMRVEIEDACKRLCDLGDDHLYYVSGLDLFGEDLVGPRLPDNLHPDGDGYEIMGRNFVEKVLPAAPGFGK